MAALRLAMLHGPDIVCETGLAVQRLSCFTVRNRARDLGALLARRL